MCLASILLSTANANINKLAKEYLSSSTKIKSIDYSFANQEIMEAIEKEQRTWNLVADYTRTDDETENNPLFSPFPVGEVAGTTTLSLQKETIFGGEFTLQGSHLSHKYSSGSKYKLYTQEISYSQDLGANFFGRTDKLALKVEEQKTQFQKTQRDASRSSSLIEFINDYLNVKRDLTIEALQNEALGRSKARLKLVSNQVKDGLKEKVDLLSTRNSHFYQIEQVNTAVTNTSSSLLNLASKLERSINKKEVELYRISKDYLLPIKEKSIDNNLSIKAIERKIDYLNSEVKKNRKSIFPSVNFEIAYGTNNYEVDDSNPIPDGTVGSSNKNVEVGLTVTVPLGFNSQKNALKAARLAKLHAEYEQKLTRVTIENRIVEIQNAIKSLDRNITSVVNRYKLANDALKEYNRLYSRGRVSLDQVIRAEEDLITTETAFVQYQVEREKRYYALLDLYGDLEEKFSK